MKIFLLRATFLSLFILRAVQSNSPTDEIFHHFPATINRAKINVPGGSIKFSFEVFARSRYQLFPYWQHSSSPRLYRGKRWQYSSLSGNKRREQFARKIQRGRCSRIHQGISSCLFLFLVNHLDRDNNSSVANYNLFRAFVSRE